MMNPLTMQELFVDSSSATTSAMGEDSNDIVVTKGNKKQKQHQQQNHYHHQNGKGDLITVNDEELHVPGHLRLRQQQMVQNNFMRDSTQLLSPQNLAQQDVGAIHIPPLAAVQQSLTVKNANSQHSKKQAFKFDFQGQGGGYGSTSALAPPGGRNDSNGSDLQDHHNMLVARSIDATASGHNMKGLAAMGGGPLAAGGGIVLSPKKHSVVKKLQLANTTTTHKRSDEVVN